MNKGGAVSVYINLQNQALKESDCIFALVEVIAKNSQNIKSKDNIEEIKPVLEKFGALDDVIGQKIIKKDFKDGVKLYLEDGTTWILVRPSGTEPLLRIYMESDSLGKIEQIKAFVQ